MVLRHETTRVLSYLDEDRKTKTNAELRRVLKRHWDKVKCNPNIQVYDVNLGDDICDIYKNHGSCHMPNQISRIRDPASHLTDVNN